ncbi:MAG: hypothetical protein JWN43_248, partial [Gammaproteobacteria bacterium]|nr:hypothetical protein [Gammaproteobacteria bacterium]
AIALSSAGKAYFELGEPKYKAAMVNASRFLSAQRYASGGFGPDEQFIRPGSGALFDSLARTKDHFETPCGSYASMKLARHLLRATGDARYGDDLERIVYNALLAVKRPDSDGGYPYYSTYGVHAVKEFYPHKWPCCSGTLVQGVADHVLNLYFRSADAIYVNLFVPSEVTWSRNGSKVKLVQETTFPAADSTTVQVQTGSPAAFGLGLRVPGWLSDSPEIRVNGVRQRVSANPGSFATLSRTWKNGDRVEMHLPQSLRTEAIDELHPETVALMRGPVLYARLDSTAAGGAPSPLCPQSIVPAGGTSELFVQNTDGQRRVFVPFHRVQNETYDVYLQRT